jgi:hypothetical protein
MAVLARASSQLLLYSSNSVRFCKWKHMHFRNVGNTIDITKCRELREELTLTSTTHTDLICLTRAAPPAHRILLELSIRNYLYDMTLKPAEFSQYSDSTKSCAVGGSRFESRQGQTDLSVLHNVQTGSGAHKTSYKMGTRG